jgi:uncharacterized protein YyaL (SSP411 family)
VLEDYAAYAQACLTLLGATGDGSWLEVAQTLLDRVLQQFVADGTFYDTAADAESLVWRPQDATDNASPSGVSLAAEAFTTLASVTGSARYEAAAQQALQMSAAIAARAPRFAGRALAVAETIASGPLEIAIIRGPAGRVDGDKGVVARSGVDGGEGVVARSGVDVGEGDFAGLLRVAVKESPWGTAVATGLPGSGVPLLEGRGLVGGEAAAFVCRRFTCRLPVVLPEDLRRELKATS